MAWLQATSPPAAVGEECGPRLAKRWKKSGPIRVEEDVVLDAFGRPVVRAPMPLPAVDSDGATVTACVSMRVYVCACAYTRVSVCLYVCFRVYLPVLRPLLFSWG